MTDWWLAFALGALVGAMVATFAWALIRAGDDDEIEGR